jgi:3-phenylpropionate/cinnamic acid dioxygenase small subunit
MFTTARSQRCLNPRQRRRPLRCDRARVTEDYEAIRRLSYEYTFLLDEGDFDGVAALLAHAELQPVMRGVASEPITGAPSIRAFYADQVVLHDGDPRTRHVISNHAIEVTGDEARARCYFTVLMKPPGEPYQTVVGGQYRDRFVREGGTWRFAEKAIQVDYLNNIAFHFRIATAHAVSEA